MSEATLIIKQAIDRNAKEIIGLVNTFADTNKVIIAQNGNGKRQFIDLLEAANQACCIEEFKLYIKYKGSKNVKKNMWIKLANPFNDTVDALMKNIVPGIEEALPETRGYDKEMVRLEVLKRFCGYLMWREHADISE